MSKKILFPFRAFLLIALVAPALGHARFDEEKRSVNMTAYTLAAGELEIGTTGIKFGVTERLQVETTLLPLFLGYPSPSVSVGYEIALDPTLSIKPRVSLEVPYQRDTVCGHGELILTQVFGERQQSYISVAVGLRYSPMARVWRTWEMEDIRDLIDVPADAEHKARPTFNLVYDRHTKNGNLFYVGLFDWMPIIGYTWAWEHFHFGVVTSPLIGLFPVPYIYFRL